MPGDVSRANGCNGRFDRHGATVQMTQAVMMQERETRGDNCADEEKVLSRRGGLTGGPEAKRSRSMTGMDGRSDER